MPTADRMLVAHSTSAAVAELPALIPAAPRPTSAGVLGMVRITATPGPAAVSRAAIETPAATETMRSAPAAAAAAAAAGASGGLTAITASRQGGTTSLIVAAGKRSRS